MCGELKLTNILGRTKDAEASLSWYRQSSNVKKELLMIQNNVHLQQSEKKGIMNVITSKVTKKSLFICAGLLTFQLTSGITPLLAYTAVIVENSHFPISDNAFLIIMSVVKIGSSLLAFFPADNFGRRPTLLISAAITTMALLGLGIFFHLQNLKVDVSSITCIPPICLIIYMIGFVIGLGTVPHIMISEVIKVVSLN